MKEFFRKITGQKKKKRRRRSAEDKPADPKKEDTRRLQRRLEDNAQTVSLRRLKKYGLQSVRVIDANSIRDIVSESVDEALRHRGATLTVGEREAVQDHAKARIMELLQENQRLTSEKTELEEERTASEGQHHELEEQLGQLRAELETRQAELQAELMAARQEVGSGTGAVPAASAPSAALQLMQQTIRKEITFSEDTYVNLEGRVKLLFERLVREGGLEDSEEVSKGLRDTIERVIAGIRQEEGASGGGPRTEKIEMLEKRIAKLNSALDTKENQIRQLAEMKMGDAGLASVYDSIQGLTFEDPDFERKGELLKEVFAQNLELQQFMEPEIAAVEAAGAAGAAAAAAAAAAEALAAQPVAAPAPAAQPVAAPAAQPEPEPRPAPAPEGLVVPDGFAKPAEVDFGEVGF